MRRDTAPLFRFDEKVIREVSGCVAGVDEAGRGPLAGPVVAAAVVLLPGARLDGLNDSKKLTASVRENLFWQICRQARFGIGVVGETDIDRINIYQASRLAMKKAVLDLPLTPAFVLSDGNMKLDLPLAQRAVVRGDGKSACIAAASILAKVYRDAWMCHLDSLYPAYHFKVHKGYPTPKHLKFLKAEGPSPVHRKSFGPVSSLAATA